MLHQFALRTPDEVTILEQASQVAVRHLGERLLQLAAELPRLEGSAFQLLAQFEESVLPAAGSTSSVRACAAQGGELRTDALPAVHLLAFALETVTGEQIPTQLFLLKICHRRHDPFFCRHCTKTTLLVWREGWRVVEGCRGAESPFFFL